jgi:hypothetical protein
MALEGVAAIVEGLNPTLIRLKLESFDPRREQPKPVAARPVPASPPAPERRPPKARRR